MFKYIRYRIKMTFDLTNKAWVVDVGANDELVITTPFQVTNNVLAQISAIMCKLKTNQPTTT